MGLLASYNRLSRIYWLGKTQLLYRPFFARLGWKSIIFKPIALKNPQNMHIGKDVAIHSHSWLLTMSLPKCQPPKLTIGDGSDIGNFNHITCVNHVEIGAKVLTADRVHISDNSHGYENPDQPIMDQSVISKGPVIIGDGTWLGENVSVLSCRIGRNCVIGANAVVTKDIPDFCVVAGVPGRIIKQFDPKSATWKRTEPRF
jgi:carbonic anhydrase/acetyltransferase-like protein (isoleucine patch superfamily)